MELKEEKPDLSNVCGKPKAEQKSHLKTEMSGQVIPENGLFATSTETISEESAATDALKVELKEEKPDLCEVCGKAKPKQKLFVCADCKTVFNVEEELDEHLKTHKSKRMAPEISFPNCQLCAMKTEMGLKEEKPDATPEYPMQQRSGQTTALKTIETSSPSVGSHIPVQQEQESPNPLQQKENSPNPVQQEEESPIRIQQEVQSPNTYISGADRLNTHLQINGPGQVVPEKEVELKGETPDVCDQPERHLGTEMFRQVIPVNVLFKASTEKISEESTVTG